MPKIAIKGYPRSERVVVLMTTTVKENLTKVAMVQRTSVNLTINAAISEYLDKHQTDIQRYNAFFGEE